MSWKAPAWTMQEKVAEPPPSTASVRNRIIDAFLQNLYGGEDLEKEPPLPPYTAASRAGTTIHQLHEWANEDSEEGRIFARQWEHAAAQGEERKIIKMTNFIVNGHDEYVTSKDGPISVFDPNSPGGVKFLTQRSIDYASIRWYLEKIRPEAFGPVAKSNSIDKARTDSENYRESVANDVIETQPDEPGPTSGS